MINLFIGAFGILASSFLARVLVGAGLVLVSAVWIGGAVEGLLDDAAASIGGATGAIVQLMALGGAGQALSIVGSAIVGRAALVAAQTFVKAATS
jgi:hypothetical protein